MSDDLIDIWSKQDGTAPAQTMVLPQIDVGNVAAAPQKASGDLIDRWEAITPQPVNAPAPNPEPSKAWSGSVLPISSDAQGNISFDSNAGVLGALKSAFTLPHDVYAGKVDPASDEGIKRTMELATFASPMSPVVRAEGVALPGIQEAIAPPTAEALHEAANAGYEQARNMGVHYSAPHVANMANAIRQELESKGIIGEVAPKSFSILERLANPPEGSVAPLAGLDATRSAFGNIAKDNPGSREQVAAGRIQQAIDEFITNPDPASVLAGPADAAAKVITDARGNYAAAKRSDKLSGIEDAAELRASVANSGQNLDNAIRQRAAAVLLKPKESYGYSPDELAAIQQVASGTPPRNVIRYVGNLLGGGGGLGAIASGAAGGAAGGFVGGPIVGGVVGAASPLVGIAAKKLGNTLTSNALNRADELVRQRSPLYEQMANEAPYSPNIPTNQIMMARALMAGQQQPDQNQSIADLAKALLQRAR
jgi:hypothetical protein